VAKNILKVKGDTRINNIGTYNLHYINVLKDTNGQIYI
jgi:hypothetical protein